MKTEKNSKNTQNRKKGFKLFARTHSVSAHLAHERDWQTDIPDIKLSRAFVFVLMLHVVAVVGILAFEFFKPDMAMEPLAGTSAAESKLADIERAEEKEQARRLRDTADGYYRYTVKTGDSLEKIADRYGLDRNEIAKLNVIADGAGIGLGTLLRLPIGEEEAKLREEEAVQLAKMAEKAKREREEKARMQREILSNESKKRETSDRMVLTEARPTAPTTPEMVESKEMDPGNTGESLNVTTRRETAPEPDQSQAIKRTETTPKIVKTLPVPEEKEKPAASRTYKVQPNDTLYAIGRKFGVSHSDILSENSMSDPRKLRIGQVLRIPEG